MERFAITAAPLSSEALTALVLDGHAARAAAAGTEGPGAVASFIGVVRNRHAGRDVDHLVYEAYEPLALSAFRRIEEELAERVPDALMAMHHRVGRLGVGEASIVIAVASAHRAEASIGCRYAIERVKQIAPIWKHEVFAGGAAWVEGATADPEDEEARSRAWSCACP